MKNAYIKFSLLFQSTKPFLYEIKTVNHMVHDHHA